MSDVADVKTVEDFLAQPEEYRTAIRKLVRSHAINELYGAQVFDEPAIAFAPTPYAKWLTCRVAMEEYGHHVRFRELGEKLNMTPEELIPNPGKRVLSIFEFPLSSWAQFCVIKMLADLAEILQVEDLLHCSFLPLRNVARSTMAEERFHADFGVQFCTELCRTESGRKEVQEAIDQYFPVLPGFFGAANSANNEVYRKWRIKLRRNEEMLEDYIGRASEVVGRLGLRLPDVQAA